MEAFFANAMQLLPEVAASPLAIAAYVGTLAAYVLVALRVTRHRHLLQHLTSLPEKDRLKALKGELGDGNLRSGITAEEWIRARIHRYYFLAFLVTCFTGVLVVAMLVFRTHGSLDIDVTGYKTTALPSEESASPPPVSFIDMANAAEFEFGMPAQLTTRGETGKPETGKPVSYSYDRSGNKLIIRPSSPFLDAIYNGTEVDALPFWWPQPFDWDFPILSVKISNNTDKTVLLSEARFEVLKSDVDVRPVLVIYQPGYEGTFAFQNEGWGKVRAVKLYISLNGPSCENDDSPSAEGSLTVSSFDAYESVDIGPLISKPMFMWADQCTDQVDWICVSGGPCAHSVPGVKCVEPYEGKLTCTNVSPLPTKAIREIVDKENRFRDSKSARVSEKDVYYERVCTYRPLCVRGRLSYVAEDGKPGIYPFRTLVYLGKNPTGGAAVPPSYSYDLFLKSGKSGYTLRREIAQQIKPGETDHFLLRIATDRSANFQLRVSLHDVKGDIRWTGDVDLQAFVPRSGAEIALEHTKH